MFKKFKPQYRIVTNKYGNFIVESKKTRFGNFEEILKGPYSLGFGKLDDAKKELEEFKKQLELEAKAGTIVYVDDLPVQEKNKIKLLKKLGLK